MWSCQPHIFISYRRADTKLIAESLHDKLTHKYRHVFLDRQDMPSNTYFDVAIEQEVRRADIVLVLIGQQWLSITDSDNNPRLFNENDYVRREVELGLAKALPVLVAPTFMPSANELPDSIKDLSRINAAVLHIEEDGSFVNFEDIVKKVDAYYQNTSAYKLCRFIHIFLAVIAFLLIIQLIFPLIFWVLNTSLPASIFPLTTILITPTETVDPLQSPSVYDLRPSDFKKINNQPVTAMVLHDSALWYVTEIQEDTYTIYTIARDGTQREIWTVPGNHIVKDIEIDCFGNIWTAHALSSGQENANSGVWVYNPTTGQSRLFNPNNKPSADEEGGVWLVRYTVTDLATPAKSCETGDETNIWLAQDKLFTLRYTGDIEQIELIAPPPALNDITIKSLFFDDSSEQLLVGDALGTVYALNPQNLSINTLLIDVETGEFLGIAQASNGDLWGSHSDGIYNFRTDTKLNLDVSGKSTAKALAVDEHFVWIGREACRDCTEILEVVSYVNEEEVRNLSDLELMSVFELIYDAENNQLWIASQQGLRLYTLPT